MTNRFNHLFLYLFCLLIISACTAPEKEPEVKPNILWIYLEDTSPLFSCYGSTLISTPHVDKLAEAGVLFKNTFAPAPVCSPSRSSVITGVMATTLGLHNHHSSRTEASAIHLPDSIKTIPELFKKAGYFTFNNGKDDYNFIYDRLDLYSQDYLMHPLYGKKGERLKIDTLKDKQPFFGQIQLAGGKEIYSSGFSENVKTPVDRKQITLPPYLPDHPVILEEYANHLDAIQVTDDKVGEIIQQLSDNNLLDNTIVFFFSDHGMRLTRHKQFLYDGGLHVPFVIADFTKTTNIGSGITNEDLISNLDLGPTSLAMADIPIPAYMEGKDIFDKTRKPREYVISARDRCDFTIDRIRSVRSKKYKYLRNFLTDRPYTQPTYMDVNKVPFVQVMKQLYAEDRLDEHQSKFLSATRPAEELYDLETDPYELNNLAEDPAYTDTLKHYAHILKDWMETTDDKGQYPEQTEGLKLMLGIWGDYIVNPEYETLQQEYPDLSGSLFSFKGGKWEK